MQPQQRTRTCQGTRAALCAAALLLSFVQAGAVATAQIARAATPVAGAPQLVMIDTDIGDDLDDVFALGLALSSPELHILGISTVWADAELKARLVDGLLRETGRTDIPVAAGATKLVPGQAPLSQARWAGRAPARTHPAAVAQMLTLIRQNPDTITLIAIGPLTNLAAAFREDPATFRKLHRIVLMGGSIVRGYNDLGYTPEHHADAEYNIATDVDAARVVFASGVPLYVMPLDATQLPLDPGKRQLLFAQGTPLTDSMALLYAQWSLAKGTTEPILFDDMAVAYVLDPGICPATPLRIAVDAQGYTRPTGGPPNAEVCLGAHSDTFFQLFMSRLLQQQLGGPSAAAHQRR